jgi:hypothetical protein
MALLSKAAVSLAGTLVAPAAVSSSDTFVPSNYTYVRVNNGGGSPDTVAFVTPATSRTLAIADAGGVVSNGTQRVFGPFPADLFADGTTGLCTITHSFTTSVTCEVWELLPLA